MRRSLLLLPLIFAAVPMAAHAVQPPVDTVAVLGDVLPQVVADSGVPVRIPTTVPVDAIPETLFASGEGRRRGYDFQIAGAPDCGGANACTYGYFSARRGVRLGDRPNVTLTGGIRGVFRPLSCGASCSPPAVIWRQGGVRYEIQLKAVPGNRRQFIHLANSAINAGPR
jgi:hypothetical protein